MRRAMGLVVLKTRLTHQSIIGGLDVKILETNHFRNFDAFRTYRYVLFSEKNNDMHSFMSYSFENVETRKSLAS